jgi:hypothetical protein
MGYPFPENWAAGVKPGLRLYASGAFVITDYSGYDPDVKRRVVDQRLAGQRLPCLPQERTVILGIQAGW